MPSRCCYHTWSFDQLQEVLQALGLGQADQEDGEPVVRRGGGVHLRGPEAPPRPHVLYGNDQQGTKGAVQSALGHGMGGTEGASGCDMHNLQRRFVFRVLSEEGRTNEGRIWM